MQPNDTAPAGAGQVSCESGFGTSSPHLLELARVADWFRPNDRAEFHRRARRLAYSAVLALAPQPTRQWCFLSVRRLAMLRWCAARGSGDTREAIERDFRALSEIVDRPAFADIFRDFRDNPKRLTREFGTICPREDMRLVRAELETLVSRPALRGGTLGIAVKRPTAAGEIRKAVGLDKLTPREMDRHLRDARGDRQSALHEVAVLQKRTGKIWSAPLKRACAKLAGVAAAAERLREKTARRIVARDRMATRAGNALAKIRAEGAAT